MVNNDGILTPDEGMMLHHGDVWSDMVMLGSLDTTEAWEELPITAYEEWLKSQEEM